MRAVYIIDVYNEYVKNDDVMYIFTLNDHYYCIRRVFLNWGKPILNYILDDDYIQFHYYETYEEAYAFVCTLQQQEGLKL